MAHKDAVVAEIARDERDDELSAAGVAVLHGELCFTSPGEARVDGVAQRFGAAVIATGSRPRVPTGIGLDDVPYLTNETIFALTALPSRLIVMGGGPIGLELGQAFARLGSAVTVLHSGDRLLEKEEPEVGDLLAGIPPARVWTCDSARDDAGRPGGRWDRRAPHGARGGEAPGQDAILVATGPGLQGRGPGPLGARRRPRSLRCGRQTGHAHLGRPGCAAGEVTRGQLFTHGAAYEGRIAGQNAAGGRAKADFPGGPLGQPFLDPEVAASG